MYTSIIKQYIYPGVGHTSDGIFLMVEGGLCYLKSLGNCMSRRENKKKHYHLGGVCGGWVGGWLGGWVGGFGWVELFGFR